MMASSSQDEAHDEAEKEHALSIITHALSPLIKPNYAMCKSDVHSNVPFDNSKESDRHSKDSGISYDTGDDEDDDNDDDDDGDIERDTAAKIPSTSSWRTTRDSPPRTLRDGQCDRPVQENKRKEKRRLREKRRSTGVVSVPLSAEQPAQQKRSTGDEDEERVVISNETKQNTATNEIISHQNDAVQLSSHLHVAGNAKNHDDYDDSDAHSSLFRSWDDVYDPFDSPYPASRDYLLNPSSRPESRSSLTSQEHHSFQLQSAEIRQLESDLIKFIQLWEEEREINREFSEKLSNSDIRVQDLERELDYLNNEFRKTLRENKRLEGEVSELGMENQALLSALKNLNLGHGS